MFDIPQRRTLAFSEWATNGAKMASLASVYNVLVLFERSVGRSVVVTASVPDELKNSGFHNAATSQLTIVVVGCGQDSPKADLLVKEHCRAF